MKDVGQCHAEPRLVRCGRSLEVEEGRLQKLEAAPARGEAMDVVAATQGTDIGSVQTDNENLQASRSHPKTLADFLQLLATFSRDQ